uniref:F-box/LRR-repeat protein 2-like isoform X6 n=2 Tax=Nyctereutes procyonoides TaxID=34880 RepID=UPI002443AAAE|nr:F-box/LRR-repeat protein 2-like isoform X6 [Nyctereutes procyonoides]
MNWRWFQRPPVLTVPNALCLFPSDAHIYSDLPASVRSERGLPRESGLVLCSPECPSGEQVFSVKVEGWSKGRMPPLHQGLERMDLSTGAVAALCRLQSGLTSLDLSGCSELADGALLAISCGLACLQCLRLRKLQRLTDTGCTALGALQELHSLNLAECGRVSGWGLARALGSGRKAPAPFASLSLAYCSSLKDASVYSLIPVLGPSLRVLDLSSCVALTNRTQQAIRASLTYLSVLRLAWCKELRDWGLLGLGDPSDEPTQEPQEHLRAKLRRNLKSRSFFPQLHQELEHQALGPKDPSPQPQGSSLLMLQALWELDLTACSKLTDASLAKVLQFPELRQLSLSLLPALTDKGLVAVARGCPSLERLVLSHCSLLSNEGWSQAASSWPRLQHLNLASCGQLTEQTLDTVGQACKQLRMLDVAMCPRISMAAVRCFQAQLPQAAGNASSCSPGQAWIRRPGPQVGCIWYWGRVDLVPLALPTSHT